MSTVGTRREPFAPAGPYALWIAGEEVAAEHGDFPAVEPSTGREWARVPQGSAADVDRAVAAARAALPAWRATSPGERQRVLWELAERVEAGPERWARLLATENGRPIREAHIADMPAAAAIYRFFSGLARDVRGDVIPVEDRQTLVYTKREPLGVIGALIPWNSPLITLANKLAPALACGNTVVVKPSELASPSVLEFMRATADVLPPGVVNVVTGDGPETGAALVSHPDVAKVSFTGGSATARKILSAAGGALTPAIMELGGKGPMVVCADADLEVAVQDAALGIFLANGEACIAASRLLVHADVHDEFRERFAALIDEIVVGDALDPATQMGPLVSAAHRDRVLAGVRAAQDEGAEVVRGGDAPALNGDLAGGHYLAPTLLADPEGRTIASRDEFFGPVTVLERFGDEAEAIARANATGYGLAAGVWTRDLARAHRIADALEAGVIWVNKWFDLPAGAPLGGVKDSGFGRETAAETINEYSATKAVNIGLSPERPALWGS